MAHRVIRDRAAGDEETIVALSLRAWEPVFRSVASELGPDLNTLLHGGDWRVHQEREVRETLARDGMRTWVADEDGRVAGFVSAAVVDPRRLIGEIAMLAVDPASQRHGIGSELTEIATEWLRESGMRVALLGTGGDEGHAPARRVYDRAGFTRFPVVQYFKAL
jgi:ribosomal protein S18 acetylase RimI-like enzyme